MNDNIVSFKDAVLRRAKTQEEPFNLLIEIKANISHMTLLDVLELQHGSETRKAIEAFLFGLKNNV